MPDGSTQVLKRVSLDDISPDPGNVAHEEGNGVQKGIADYQKEPSPLQPELKLTEDLKDPDTPTAYTIQDGHHRITAGARNGDVNPLSWIPEEAGADDAAAERIKTLTSPEPSPTQGLPATMQKAVADANYRGIKEGAEGADPAQLYKGAAQAKKAEALSQQLYDANVPHADLSKLPPAQLKTHLSDLTKAMGINKDGSISSDTIGETLFRLKKLEVKNKPQLVK